MRARRAILASSRLAFGPVEEGTVVARRDWGVEVRLDSGQIGQLRDTLMQESFDPVPEERWPGIGERVRIRPLGLWPDGSLRVSGRPRFVNRPPDPPWISPHATA